MKQTAKNLKLIMLACVMLAAAIPAIADVDWVYYGSGFNLFEVSPDDYSQVLADRVSSNAMLVGTANSLAWAGYTGQGATGWEVKSMFSDGYKDLSQETSATNVFYGIRNNGTIDQIVWTGAASRNIITDQKVYNAVVDNGADVNVLYAAHSGGVDQIYYSSGWSVNSNIVTASYAELAQESNGTNKFYGTLASGGVGLFYHNGSSWVTETLTASGNYYSLVNDSDTDNSCFAIMNGDIYQIYYDSGGIGWTSVLRVEGSYNDIDMNGTGGYLFGARSDGGMDQIITSNWQVNFLTATAGKTYLAISADDAANSVYGVIPEPTTLILLGLGGSIVSFVRKRR